MHRNIFLFEGPVSSYEVVAGIGWEFITTKTQGCLSKDLVIGGEFSGFHHETSKRGNESWMTTWIWPMVMSMICALYWYHNLTSYNVSLINRFYPFLYLFCIFFVYIFQGGPATNSESLHTLRSRNSQHNVLGHGDDRGRLRIRLRTNPRCNTPRNQYATPKFGGLVQMIFRISVGSFWGLSAGTTISRVKFIPTKFPMIGQAASVVKALKPTPALKNIREKTGRYTLPKFDALPLKSYRIPNRRGSSSNHHFSGANCETSGLYAPEFF